MSSRCATRKPAASHTFLPPASSSGSTGPPGAAMPIVAPGAIARGFVSRGCPTLEVALVGRAAAEVVATARPAARCARRRFAREACALGQTELAAALVGEVAELRVLAVELELDRAGR